MGTGADATITNLVVANLSASAKANARNDLVSDGARGAWDFLSRTWRANPLRRELDFVAKVTFPYDVAKLPTVKATQRRWWCARATDGVGLAGRAGAVFDAPPKVTVLGAGRLAVSSPRARRRAGGARARAAHGRRAVDAGRRGLPRASRVQRDGLRLLQVRRALHESRVGFQSRPARVRRTRALRDAAVSRGVRFGGVLRRRHVPKQRFGSARCSPRRLVSRVSPSSGPDTGAALGARRRGVRAPRRRREAGRRVPFRRLAISAASRPASRCPRGGALRDARRTRSATPRCAWAWRVTARTTRAPPPTGTASRWRTPSSRSAGTARRKTEEDRTRREPASASGAGGAVVDARGSGRSAAPGRARQVLVRSCGGRSATRLRKRRGAPLRGARGRREEDGGARRVFGRAGRASGGVSVRREEDSFFWAGLPPSGRPASRAGVSRHDDPERFAASLFVGEDGRYGARPEMAAAATRDGRLSAKKTKPRCALGGVAAATELASSELTKVRRAVFFPSFPKKKTCPRRRPRAMYHDEWSRRFRRRETRVRFPVAPPRAGAPTRRRRRTRRSCWFLAERGAALLRPRRRARPRGPGRARPARGRAPAPARRRRVGPGTNAGFGWERRRLDVRGRRVRRRVTKKRPSTKKTPTEKKTSSAPRGSSPRRWSRRGPRRVRRARRHFLLRASGD